MRESFLESIKSLLLMLQNDASAPSYYMLVTILHCQQAQRKYMGHAESSLGLAKAKLKAEIQIDNNTF